MIRGFKLADWLPLENVTRDIGVLFPAMTYFSPLVSGISISPVLCALCSSLKNT